MKAKRIMGWVSSLSCKAKIIALVAVGFVVANSAQALDIVTQDEATGAPIFAPEVITTPIGVGVIGGYCAIAGVLLIAIGCGWMLRIVSQKRS